MNSSSVSLGVPPTYFEENFGVTDEVLRRLLGEALSQGGDYADLYFQHSQATSLDLEDNIVSRAGHGIDLGVGIRVLRGEQTGYAFTESIEPGSMLAAARTAAAIASSQRQAPPAELTLSDFPHHYPIDPLWDEVDVGAIMPLLSSLNVRAHQQDSLVEKVQLSFSANQTRVLVVDSEGRMRFDSQPMTFLHLSVTMKKGSERQSGSYNLAARQGFSFYTEERLERMVSRALARTRLLFDARKPPAGEMPVVLAAGSSGILLHEAIGHGLEADFNRKGTSIFSDRMGKVVSSPHVNVVDSGVEPGLRGSINIDDEGNESKSTLLVENGELRSYLHDRLSARHYGVEPTGSGRRQSFRHTPMPRMRNTYMLAGPHGKEEIISSVKRGIYCITFGNGQVDIGQGDYAFYVKTGFLIEDGKLTAPIKDVNLIGNGPESLERITMVGDDLAMDDGGWTCGKKGQSVPVSLGQPTLLVSSVNVGGVGA